MTPMRWPGSAGGVRARRRAKGRLGGLAGHERKTSLCAAGSYFCRGTRIASRRHGQTQDIKQGRRPHRPAGAQALAALGCGQRLDEYHRWCAAHGFRARTDKTHAEMEAELRALAADKAHIQQQARVHQNPRKLIEAVCSGRIGSPALQERPHLQRFCRAIETSRTGGRSREALAVLLRKVHDEADFLFNSRNFRGAMPLHRRADQAQRSPRIVDPPARGLAAVDTQRPPAVCFAGAPSAGTLSGACLHGSGMVSKRYGSQKLRDWFVHIGDGKNIRSAGTPIPLTKLMAHHFMQAPDEITIEGALRWGQILTRSAATSGWSMPFSVRVSVETLPMTNSGPRSSAFSLPTR